MDEDVHKTLKVYIAQNSIKTLSAGVRDLLIKVLGPSKVPLETTSNAPKPKVIEELSGECEG